jgi:hypothetical protein
MKALSKMDFVLYNQNKEDVIRFSNGDVVIYGDKQEALYDQKAGAIAWPCTDLPTHLLDELINQINKH